LNRGVALLDRVPQVADEDTVGQPLARDAELDIDRRPGLAIPNQIRATNAPERPQPPVVHRELDDQLGRLHGDNTALLAGCEGHCEGSCLARPAPPAGRAGDGESRWYSTTAGSRGGCHARKTRPRNSPIDRYPCHRHVSGLLYSCWWGGGLAPRGYPATAPS